MSTDYSKTLLRKGTLKTHGGVAIPGHMLRRKSGTSDEEAAILLSYDKTGAHHAHGAKMRAE